jgi:hypothetical protein
MTQSSSSRATVSLSKWMESFASRPIWRREFRRMLGLVPRMIERDGHPWTGEAPERGARAPIRVSTPANNAVSGSAHYVRSTEARRFERARLVGRRAEVELYKPR